MKKQTTLPGICAILGMLVLILDGKTALSGAAEGLELCLKTVIPALFPFFILSILLTSSLSGTEFMLLRPLGRLFRIPRGCETILLSAFLGGYPVGAQAVASALEGGQLRREQANRMLTFCSNAGPSFLFGILAPQFSARRYAWLLWGVHILSALAVSFVFPAKDAASTTPTPHKNWNMAQVMKKAVHVMASVCGWVILFRVLLRFLDRWFLWMLPLPAHVLVTGLLELTNGCCSLSQVSSEGLRFVIGALMVSFGGICVTMQTFSVSEGLNMRFYIIGKILQTLFSLLLAALCQGFFPGEARFFLPTWLLCLNVGAMILISLSIRKKTVAIPGILLYNKKKQPIRG